MLKKIAFLFFALLSAITTNAADTSKQATKILDKVADKVSVSKGVTMSFSISGAKINQTGTIQIKGKKFHAHTPNADMWFDGTTQWVLNKNSEEVNVSHPNASRQATMNPYTFLHLYKQGYTKSVETKGNQYIVHLVGKGKSISEMYVTVDKSYNLKQVKYKQGNNWMTINISNIKNQALGDSNFQFNRKDYPHAEIIDLR